MDQMIVERPLADDEEDMASAIGSNLASAAAGPVGSFVFGQMMSALGFAGHDAVADALDKISGQLTTLQNSVNTLMTEMNDELTQLNYDLVIAPVAALMAANQTLLESFQVLAADSDDASRAATRATISGPLQQMVTAPSVWNDALTGLAGETGIIAAWSRVVHTHAGDFFGELQTDSIQQHWNYLDGQQALSVMYAVEHAHSVGDAAGASKILVDWRTNRTAQLALLRGMPNDPDVFDWCDPDTKQITSVTTPVNALPNTVSISTIGGFPTMVYTTVTPPVSGAAIDRCVAAAAAEIASNTGLGAWTDSPPQVPLTSWNLLMSPFLLQFLNACGGNVGNGGDDTFAAALQSKGFGLGPTQRLWTDVPRKPDGTPAFDFEARDVYVEGGSWWHPSTDPDDTACLLFARQLEPGESDTYWYANA